MEKNQNVKFKMIISIRTWQFENAKTLKWIKIYKKFNVKMQKYEIVLRCKRKSVKCWNVKI